MFRCFQACLAANGSIESECCVRSGLCVTSSHWELHEAAGNLPAMIRITSPGLDVVPEKIGRFSPGRGLVNLVYLIE